MRVTRGPERRILGAAELGKVSLVSYVTGAWFVRFAQGEHSVEHRRISAIMVCQEKVLRIV